MRYYIHGDYHEENKDMIYCKRCDAFEKMDHFYNDHKDIGMSNYQRATGMLIYFNKMKQYKKDNGLLDLSYRPENALNAWL